MNALLFAAAAVVTLLSYRVARTDHGLLWIGPAAGYSSDLGRVAVAYAVTNGSSPNISAHFLPTRAGTYGVTLFANDSCNRESASVSVLHRSGCL